MRRKMQARHRKNEEKLQILEEVLQMRSLLFLGLVAVSGAACSRDLDACKTQLGEDLRPPIEVRNLVQSKFRGHRLIDKKDCDDEVYWLLISSEQPVNKPRRPGSDKLVVMEKETRKVLVIDGE